MADIINLNKAREAKAKSAKVKQAAQNRALFGLSKAQKSKASLENEIKRRILEAARRSRESLEAARRERDEKP